MAKYQVVEIFDSINGEGMRAGELAVFVRMKGCNLHCSYCDTSWANQETAEYHLLTEEEICEKIVDRGIHNVTITGGEPLLQPEIGRLLACLGEAALRVEVETNGSVSVQKYRSLEYPPSFTIDYKLPGSGMEDQMCLENFQNISSRDTVKFVVSDRRDLLRAEQVMERYALPSRCHVILSPVFGRIDPKEIVAVMQERLWNEVRLQLQMHKLIWDPEQRGV